MYAAPLHRLGALQPRPKGTSSLQDTPQHQEKSSPLQYSNCSKGRPCRALSLFIQSYPRVWSPFQGCAPWALKGLPRWGLSLLSEQG